MLIDFSILARLSKLCRRSFSTVSISGLTVVEFMTPILAI